jgi:hypothetical protein
MINQKGSVLSKGSENARAKPVALLGDIIVSRHATNIALSGLFIFMYSLLRRLTPPATQLQPSGPRALFVLHNFLNNLLQATTA